MDRNELLVALLGGSRGYIKGVPAPKVLLGTDPAANAEVAAADFVVPTGKIWIPLSFSVVLVQGATQTPTPALVWDDGTNVLGAAPGCSAAVSVSTTTRMTWTLQKAALLTAGAGLTANVAPMPDVKLEAGYRLSTLTAGIGANTNYGVPVLHYIELAA